jgi:hypothetical protein
MPLEESCLVVIALKDIVILEAVGYGLFKTMC